MKKCPFCAEEIQDAAIKCKHCGSMLDGSPAPQPGAMVQVPETARPVFGGTPSWKAFVGRYLLAGLLCVLAVGGGVVGLMRQPLLLYLGVGAAVALAAGLVLLASAEFQRRFTRLRITTRSVDVETGVLSRRIDTLQLWRVRDVEFQQSLGERLLGIARIRLVTHDTTDPTLVLAGLPGSRVLFDEIRNAVEAARQSRNVVGVIE